MDIPKGTKPAFGYKWKDGELIHVPDEALIYKELFDLFLIYQKKSRVANLLNEQGYRTRSGKTFNYGAVNRLLRNKVAKGIYSYTGYDKEKKVNIMVEVPVPAIVSEEIWNSVQYILDTASSEQTRTPTQDVFIGKIVCMCTDNSYSMEILSKSTNYSCYHCKYEISIDDIHALFEAAIQDVPFPDMAVINELSNNDIESQQYAIHKKIAQIERDKEKLFELHSSEAISIDIFKDRHDRLEKQRKELQKNLESKERKKTKDFAMLLAYWQNIDHQTKQLVADFVLDKICIYQREKATVSLYPLFNFAQEISVRATNEAILETDQST